MNITSLLSSFPSSPSLPALLVSPRNPCSARHLYQQNSLLQPLFLGSLL